MSGSKTGCELVRKQAPAHIAGDTSVLEKQRLDAHLAHCEACRISMEDITALMEAGRAERHRPTPAMRDRMWEGLANKIELSVKPPLPREKRFDAVRPWPRRAVIAAAALAAVGLFMLGFFVQRDGKPPRQALRQTAPNVFPAPTLALAPPPTPLPRLIAEQVGESLVVGKTQETQFHSEQRGTRRILTLTRGTLWISFKRSPAIAYLEVAAPGGTVFVTGTVLMVQVEPEKPAAVGVLQGRVRVVPEDGMPTALSDGQMLVLNDRKPTAMDPQRREQAAVWLADLVQERGTVCRDSETDVLEDAAAPPKNNRRAPVAADLYAKAEAEMAAGDFATAASLLEKVVTASPDSARADTARLDLSRLYVKHLNKPNRAAMHLKSYLARHPGSANAPLLQKQLCEISGECGE